MNKKLRADVERLALDFAGELLGAIRGAQVDEILAAITGSVLSTAGAGGSFAKGNGRRSARGLEGTADAIVALLHAHRSGLRSEQIRSKLGVAKGQLSRSIGEALRAKRIVKTGQRRATTYFARG